MTSSNDVRSNSDVLGILFGRDKLDGCRVARTLFGTMRHQHHSVEIVDGDLDAALAELLSQLRVSKGTPLPIVAALPTNECYFATRPIASGAANASPRVLLRESLRSSATRMDQMAIDVIHWQPDRRSVAGIVAAPIERVEAIREAVGKTKHSLQRLEPAASCLIAMAPEIEGRERRTNLTTRVFLGEASMLAVMSRGPKPIHWQAFPLPAGDEATGIVSAIRSLETAASACGLDRTPDTVAIHGRPELQTLIDQQWLTENVQSDFRWIDTPTLHGRDIAQAAADRFLASEDDGFDLVRQHRDPLQLRRVVPYREVAFYLVAGGVLAAILWLRHADMKDEYASLVATAPPMIAEGTNPKSEQDRLNARATAVSQFLDKRVQWSNLLGEITRLLPEGTRLTGIRGSAPMAQRRKKHVKISPTTLILQAECILDDSGNLPLSLDRLPAMVQAIPCISKHFKRVEIGDVRRTESQQTGVAGAEFSVILTNDAKGGELNQKQLDDAMAQKRDWRQELEQVAQQLRDPFRMRIAVAGVTLAVMYFAVSSPLHGRMQRSQREFDRMKTTAKTAEEVLLLRSHLQNVDNRILRGKSNDVVVSHLMDLVRNEPVDLMRIDAEAPSRLGPIQSLRISMDVTGSFDALAKLLYRLEADHYLLRIETLAINPPQRDSPNPSMQLQLRALKDPS